MKFFILLSAFSVLSAVQGVHVIHAPLHHSYHGPGAPLDGKGRVIDTPEVSHAKAAHFKAYNEELSKAKTHYGGGEVYEDYHHEAGPAIQVHHGGHYEAPHGYHGPPAPLAHDGRVIDTPEVAHAKHAHFAAYAEELSKVSHHQPAHGLHYL